jgi:coenzyme F420-reducing hydrogenase gamma subunit
MPKPRVGIFKYTCCAGCQFQLIHFIERLKEVLEAIDIVYGKMETDSGSEAGPFTVALIEGAITEAEQADQLKRVRQSSKYLVPIGSCAVNGGIPAIKNMTPELEVERKVYEDVSPMHSMKAHAVSEYVEVDAVVRGCPVGERDLYEQVASLLLDRKPNMVEHCVCVECKMKGNPCLLVTENVPCMGPVTNGGCGALCPSNGRACYGCWGPMSNANSTALAEKFEEIGLPPDEIVRRFSLFGYPTVEFHKVAGVR